MDYASAFKARGAKLPRGMQIDIMDHPDGGASLRLSFQINSATDIPGASLGGDLASLVPLVNKAVRALRRYAASDECWEAAP